MIQNDEFKKLIQIGMVVSDLDKTLDNFQKVLGIGPFKVVKYPTDEMTEPERAQREYKGSPANFSAYFCFFDFGNIEFEIIQPLEGESTWSDFLKEKGPGLHHLKFLIKNYDEVKDELNRKGFEMVQRGPAVGMNRGREWSYFDATETLGINIELMNEIIV